MSVSKIAAFWEEDTARIRRIRFINRFTHGFVFHCVVSCMLVLYTLFSLCLRFNLCRLFCIGVLIGETAVTIVCIKLWCHSQRDISETDADFECMIELSYVRGRIYDKYVVLKDFEFLDETKQIRCPLTCDGYVYFGINEDAYENVENLADDFCYLELSNIVSSMIKSKYKAIDTNFYHFGSAVEAFQYVRQYLYNAYERSSWT